MKLFQRRFHPCGGYYLVGALKWLIPSNFGLVFIGLGAFVFDFVSNWNIWMREKEEAPTEHMIRLSIWVMYILFLLGGLMTEIFLYRAVKNRNVLKLKIWPVVNFFNTVLGLVGYTFRITHFGLHLSILLPFIFSYFIYRFYMCVVIYYYRIEVEEEKELEAAARMLTEAELKEFEEGLTESETILRIETDNLVEKVQYLKYKKEEFEIKLENLDIDKENPLGKGSFGVVFKGVYHSKDGTSREVAVKTFESGFMDAMCFKALLTELKVMTCLGQHENVLKLIGAVTENIKSRSLMMAIELCPFGCVLEYLRASRGLFQNLVVDGIMCVGSQSPLFSNNFSDEESLSTLDLWRWMIEIASGMAYLEDMKVIHGDLAARNLLLSSERKIKISDFGLARQLYQYSVYVKRQKAPLPWRWLAIESITDMNFSSKSDVWAYGIVLHELFSLGEVPYCETKQFSLKFIENLRDGMRLEQAPFCPDIIYHCMSLCWNEDPDQRPSFHDLNRVIQSLGNNDTALII